MGAGVPGPAPPGPSPSPGTWGDWLEARLVSYLALWAVSQLLWVTAHITVIYFRCKRSLWKHEPLSCVIYAFLGNVCNMLGALLANQLGIQVFTAAYMAAMDVLHFVLILFPDCGSRSRSGRSRRRRRRRERGTTLLLACLPFVVGTGCYLWPSPVGLVDVHGPGRRLLSSLPQDGTEVIGYALGVTAILIGWTSKIPLVIKASRGKITECSQKTSLVFTILASVFYAVAILSQDKRAEFILRALPWLLIYLGGAAMDISVLYLLFLLRDKDRRQQWGLEMVVEPDTISLLPPPGQQEAGAELHTDTQSTDWVPLNIPQNNRYLRKMAEIGHYLDLSIEPVQEIGFAVERLPGDGQICIERKSKMDGLLVYDPPMYPPLHVIQANMPSCSSSDATSISSELEWDFENMPQRWKMSEKTEEKASSHSSGSAETITEERTSAILAQYEEEINRTGQRTKRSLLL